MSWASHTPEAYEEIVTHAIVDKLIVEVGEEDENPEGFVLSIVETIREGCPDAYKGLASWAHEETLVRERDHWADLTDSLVEGPE